jgi:hypothetical protein
MEHKREPISSHRPVAEAQGEGPCATPQQDRTEEPLMAESVNIQHMKATAESVRSLGEELIALADRGAAQPVGTKIEALEATANWIDLALALGQTAESIRKIRDQATQQARETRAWFDVMEELEAGDDPSL